MPDQTLAQLVRAKYPGAYTQLSDQALESAVRAKYPGVYDTVPSTAALRTDVPADVAQQLADLPNQQGAPDSMLQNARNMTTPRALATAAGVAASAATGGLAAPAALATVGLAGAGGAGAGSAIQQLASGRPQSAGAVAGTMAREGGLQAAGEGAGRVVGAAMQKAGPYLMAKAVKASDSLLKEYKTTAPQLAKTLLDEGINVTQAGLDKLQILFKATNDEIRDAVNAATGSISKKNVASRALVTAAKMAKQVNPTADLKAVGDTVDEFVNHPVYTGDLSVPEAQAMKVGTYQQIGKKYGEVSSAGIETSKALARGLKEEIAAEAPAIAGLNARDSSLMTAMDAVGRRVAIAGRADPVGFAWVAHNPTTFLAAMIDRHPAVKSLLARGLYNAAGSVTRVAPQLIRTAVVSLASGQPALDAGPQQALSPTSGGR